MENSKKNKKRNYNRKKDKDDFPEINVQDVDQDDDDVQLQKKTTYIISNVLLMLIFQDTCIPEIEENDSNQHKDTEESTNDDGWVGLI